LGVGNISPYSQYFHHSGLPLQGLQFTNFDSNFQDLVVSFSGFVHEHPIFYLASPQNLYYPFLSAIGSLIFGGTFGPSRLLII